MLLRNDIWLIGDFLGTVPATIALAKLAQERGEHLKVFMAANDHELFDDLDNARQLLRMVPSKYGVEEVFAIDASDPDVRAFQLMPAFARSVQMQQHMTAAHHHFIELADPSMKAIRPELEIGESDVPAFDYALAPFSRSLPPHDKWQRERWQTLVDRMPDRSFVIFGGKHDEHGYLVGDNVTEMYCEPLRDVMHVLKRLRYGLLSCVTGLSHMAYALGVRNYLFYAQGAPWGLNPDALLIGPGAGGSPIAQVKTKEVVQALRRCERVAA